MEDLKFFQANIYLKNERSGGRKTLPRSGYKPRIYGNISLKDSLSKTYLTNDQIKSSINSDGVIFYREEFLPLNTVLRCVLLMDAKTPLLNFLEASSKFYIAEFKHIVGSGEILEELDTMPGDVFVPTDDLASEKTSFINSILRKAKRTKHNE